jgi:hypothetical protein
MFRIIRFKVPADRLMALYEQGVSAAEQFQDASGGLGQQGDYFYSVPMATTSARFFICEQYLRSMFGDPPHLIEDLTKGYRLLRTRAPKAYDYDYCIDIGTMPGEFGEERLVAMPADSVNYQSGRYSSGMFTPITCG